MDYNNEQNIYLGISKKSDGPMKTSSENRLVFLRKRGLDNKIIISAELVHKNKVVVIENIDKDTIIPACDALITNNNKYLLTITVADCLPIYFYDRNNQVVALAHGGWRGVESEIVKEVINQFVSYYNSKLDDIEVYVGPHIKDCHFEVKDDVASQFKSSDSIIRKEKIYINLAKIVTEQLIQSGIRKDNINLSQDCTYCLDKKYFSYRRDKPQELEAMLAYIGLK